MPTGPRAAQHGQGLGQPGLLGGRVVGLEQPLQQGRVVVGAFHLVQQRLLVVGHHQDPAGDAEEGPLGGGGEFLLLVDGGQFGAAAADFGGELLLEPGEFLLQPVGAAAVGDGHGAVPRGGHEGEDGEHAGCRYGPLSHRHAANSRVMILRRCERISPSDRISSISSQSGLNPDSFAPHRGPDEASEPPARPAAEPPGRTWWPNDLPGCVGRVCRVSRKGRRPVQEQ